MALLRYYVGEEPAPGRKISFVLSDVKDRVYIYNETALHSFVDRQGINGENKTAHSVEIDMSGSAYFDLLIENNGRQNFSPAMLLDKKGLTISMLKVDGGPPKSAGTLALCRKLVMDSLVASPSSPGRLRSAFPHPGRGAAGVVPM